MSPAESPKNVAELLALIAKLNSRKAVFRMLITHLRTCYQASDTGEAEMRVLREDSAVVPNQHIEDSIIELETAIDLINAELEELAGKPFGGGPPPAAEDAKEEEAAVAKPAETPTERKAHGKARTSGGRPS